MNDLKLINDVYGHNVGDKALSEIASIFLKNERKNIKFYRIGGDEFVALCFNFKEKDVKNIIAKIKEELCKINYSCSFGYAMRKDNKDIFELYKDADKKMYKEKVKYHKK